MPPGSILPFEHHILFSFDQSIACFVEVDPDDIDDEFNEHDSEEDDDDSPSLDIWVLKIKENMIDKFFSEEKISVSPSENVCTEVLGLRNNGDPILEKSNNLITYVLKTREPYDLGESCNFVESFDRFASWAYYKYGFPSLLVICPFCGNSHLS